MESFSHSKKTFHMINRMCYSKKNILVNKQYAKKTIVVDFYNLYCSITRFNKYKTFTRESYIHCLNLITKKFSGNKLTIVSKDVYEIDHEYIKRHTSNNPNLTYIISYDEHSEKSMNRERDDYVCLLMNHTYTESGEPVLLISNDKLRNIEKIIKYVKPMRLQIFNRGLETSVYISTENIQQMSEKLIAVSFPDTAEFKFE